MKLACIYPLISNIFSLWQVRDEVFDHEEKLFRGLEKAVRQLVKNVQCYLQHTQVDTWDSFLFRH